MKVDVFKLGRGELVFYPSVVGRVFSVRHFDNPVTLIGTIDLPIEKPKEESGLPVSTVEYRRGFADEINKIRSQIIDQLNTLNPKKKLVTKEAVELHLTSALIMDGSGASYPVFCVPSNAKNVRCTYEVEE